MALRMTMVVALVGALGFGACGKKADEVPPETTAPAQQDTVKAVEADTAKAVEADTVEAVAPDTAKAVDNDTVEAVEADTVKVEEPDTVKTDEADTTAALAPGDEADTATAGADPADGDEVGVEPLIEITDSALSVEIEDRMPVARATAFSGVGTIIQAWIEAKSEIDTEVTITWRKEDKVAFEFQMRVGKSPHWRTWARKKIGKKDAGQWHADIKDANGTLLVSLPFTIEAPVE